MIWFFSAAAWAACDSEVAAAEFITLSTQVEIAFADLDGERLSSSAIAARDALPCVNEKLLPVDAAAFFRHQGMAAFIARDRSLAVELFASARHLDPAYRMDPSLVGDDHPMRKLYEATPIEAPPSTVELPDAADGWIAIDGHTTQTAPVGRPYLFQRFGPTGDVVSTRGVLKGESPPEYPVATENAGKPPKPDKEPKPPKPEGTPSQGRSLELSLLGGALYYPNQSGQNVFGGGTVLLALPLADQVHLEGGVLASMRPSSVDCPDGRETCIHGLWIARLGATYRFGTEGVQPFVGVTLLATFHDDESVITPGIAPRLGLHVPLSDQVKFTGEALVGTLTGHTKDEGLQVAVQGQIGVTFSL